MQKYDIKDIWFSLKLASKNFFILFFIIWFVARPVFLKGVITNDNLFSVCLILTAIVFFQSIIIYIANRKYVIDLEEGTFKFPRSDMENSIIAIILLFRYWNLMRTKTINCDEIENIYIDTKRWTTKNKTGTGLTSIGKTKYTTTTKNHVLYTINIAGAFGSANLPFSNRQKRDEVRNAIQQCVHYHKGKNIDKKVAEFN